MTLDPRHDDRVRRHTPAAVNTKIDRLTRAAIEDSATSGRDAVILRLHELDREWDVDRVLMANFAAVGLVTSLFAGRRRDGNWVYPLRAQMGFLLMHAIVGWCPPLAIWRRLGVRTAKEIALEREALTELLEAEPETRLGDMPAPSE